MAEPIAVVERDGTGSGVDIRMLAPCLVYANVVEYHVCGRNKGLRGLVTIVARDVQSFARFSCPWKQALAYTIQCGVRAVNACHGISLDIFKSY